MQFKLNLNIIGYFLIFISFVIFFTNISFSLRLMNLNDILCSFSSENQFDFCPYVHTITPESLLLFFVSLFLIVLGVYLSIKFPQIDSFDNPNKSTHVNVDKILKNLGEEEALVFKKLVEENGIYQSKLPGITGYSRVKITRILDRLESRGLIERKRRGMTNFVFVKVKL